jgi:hypothetical protein
MAQWCGKDADFYLAWSLTGEPRLSNVYSDALGRAGPDLYTAYISRARWGTFRPIMILDDLNMIDRVRARVTVSE